LPDGSEFALGEQRLTFTKTIGRAAEVLQPGERVQDQSEMPDP